ncbi:hypothetical protein ES703_87968 [subsurface metagenome]
MTLSAEPGATEGLQFDAVVHDEVAPCQVKTYPVKVQLVFPVLSTLRYAVIGFAPVRLLLSSTAAYSTSSESPLLLIFHTVPELVLSRVMRLPGPPFMTKLP